MNKMMEYFETDNFILIKYNNCVLWNSIFYMFSNVIRYLLHVIIFRRHTDNKTDPSYTTPICICAVLIFLATMRFSTVKSVQNGDQTFAQMTL